MTEADRFKMHLGLRNMLGDEVANSLMEHLPPSGWSDVARVRDIERIEAEMKDGFTGIRNTLRATIAAMIAVSIGIVAMFVQLNQLIAGL